MSQGGHASGPPDRVPVVPAEAKCYFCRTLSDPAASEPWCVYEDDLLVATHQVEDVGPSYLGSILVQTKRHTEGLAGLTDPEAERLGRVVARVSRALVETVGASWTYSYGFMEAFRHVHTIIDARYPDLPREYFRLRIHEWPGAPQGDREAVGKLVRTLRARTDGSVAVPRSG